MLRLLILLFALALPAIEAEAGHKDPCEKKYSRRIRKHPEKLVAKITKGLSDDSSKLRAIACWISYNLRYDVKRYIKGDSRLSSIRQTLIRRKGMCMEYSSLFREMCNIINVPCVLVGGYVKTKERDIIDTLFVEDHAWNAVYINGQWYLSDLTWASGHIAYYRKSLLSRVLSFLEPENLFRAQRKDSGKKVTFLQKQLYRIHLAIGTRYIYDPHFVKSRSPEFELNKGNFFLHDHYPASSLWVLSNDTMTVEKFMRDSAWYKYEDRNLSVDYDSDPDAERMTYHSLSDTQQIIQDGYSFTQANYTNHLHKSESFLLEGLQAFRDIDFRSKDSSQQLIIADTLLRYGREAMKEVDSALYYNEKEYRIRTAHLVQKNTLQAERDRRVLRHSSDILKYTRKNDFKIRSLRNTFKIQHRSNVRKLMALFRNDRKNPVKERADKTNQREFLKQGLDSLQNISAELNSEEDTLYNKAFQLNDSYYHSITLSLNKDIEIFSNLSRILSCKILLGEDEFDYYVNRFRRKIDSLEKEQDSLLMIGQFNHFDSIRYLMKKAAALSNENMKIMKQQLSIIRKLQSFDAGDTLLMNQRKEVLINMYAKLDKFHDSVCLLSCEMYKSRLLTDDYKYVHKLIKRQVRNDKKLKVRKKPISMRRRLLSKILLSKQRKAKSYIQRAEKTRQVFTKI